MQCSANLMHTPWCSLVWHLLLVHIIYICVNSIYTVGCRYNKVQYNTILLSSLQLQKQNINQSVKKHKTPISRPNERAIGCVFWGFSRKKFDRVLTAPHWIYDVYKIYMQSVLPVHVNTRKKRQRKSESHRELPVKLLCVLLVTPGPFHPCFQNSLSHPSSKLIFVNY